MNTLATTSASGQIAAVLANLALREPLTVEGVGVRKLGGHLTSPFVIASDASKRDRVDNVLVSLEVEGGSVGYGEAAPFKGISGDTQDLLMEDIRRAVPGLCTSKMSPLMFSSLVKDRVKFPAARAALEMAFLDALARRRGESFYSYLLNREAKARPMVTDITIPIMEPFEALRLAREYREMGFRRIKIKVGDEVERAFERVESVVGAFAAGGITDGLEILLDANEGYKAQDAIMLMWLMRNRLGKNPAIFEQPVRRDDLEGMHAVRLVGLEYDTHVFADESVFNVQSAAALIQADAADGINLKLMKHGGPVQFLKIAELASDAGLKLMVGGMLETSLAMTASLHLAQLVDPFWLDLDTPLLMDVEGLAGGMVYDGARIMLPEAAGIGVEYVGDI